MIVISVANTTGGSGRPGAEEPSVVFVFPGQGAQRPGMGCGLLADIPQFTDHMRRCDEVIREEAGWSLLDWLLSGAPMRGESRIQPALWALQVCIAQLWRDWGVLPRAVIGASMGEIAAAVIAGSLTLQDGAALVCRRSALLETLEGTGDMWVVQLSEPAARQAIAGFAGRLWVAAVNSDSFTTLSGDSAALLAIVEPLIERKVFCRKLRAGLPSHTPRMDVVLDQLKTGLGRLYPREADIPMRSTVLDAALDGTELTAEYWAANLREPVRFARACRSLMTGGQRCLFIEISPQPVLVAAIEDNIVASGTEDQVIPSLRREWPEADSLLTSLKMARAQGCELDWDHLRAGS